MEKKKIAVLVIIVAIVIGILMVTVTRNDEYRAHEVEKLKNSICLKK
jgi:preprotein translocase subunit YajC